MDQPVPQFRILPGLPPYGPLVQSFPESRTGSEGLVVEFLPKTAHAWIGNFGKGIGGYSGAHLHPNGHDIVVFSKGNAFVVEPLAHEVHEYDVPGSIAGVWEVSEPAGLILDRQGLAFERISAEGLVWHTRRLSWDGFRSVSLAGDTMTGEAWSPMDEGWKRFSLDLLTGESEGGSFTEFDSGEWERLAK